MLERVTIGDVAERAGVSIATVSRVVNGRYGVAPATFERVKAVIADLGYESSLIARSLRSQRTNVIGVLVDRHRAVQRRGLEGCGQRVARRRVRVGRLLRWSWRRSRRLGAALHVASQRHADRRHRPGHTDGHRGADEPAGRRRRPADRRVGLPDVRIAELRRRARRDTSPDRARSSPDRVPRRPPATSNRLGCASRATAPGSRRPASPSIPSSCSTAVSRRSTAEAPARQLLSLDRRARRRSSPPTTRRRSRPCALPPSSASTCPTTCR